MSDHPQARAGRFGVFDPTDEVEKSYRNLPHWFQPGVATFITFRTADSMPKHVIERWRAEQEDWLCQHGLSGSAAADLKQVALLPARLQREFRRLRDRLWHRSLDDCHGACLLREPGYAQIVGNALLHFHGERYDLESFVVMPNHVHVLVQFRPPTTLRHQSESWLRYTAGQINKRMGKTGPFWQSEPFDHLIRSPEQFEYLQRYVADNPNKANLRPGEYLYWSRVARFSES